METVTTGSRRKSVAPMTMMTRQRSAVQGTPSPPISTPDSPVPSTNHPPPSIDPDDQTSSLSSPREVSPPHQLPPRTALRQRQSLKDGHSRRHKTRHQFESARTSQERVLTPTQSPSIDDVDSEGEEEEKRLSKKMQRLQREARCWEMKEEIARLERTKEDYERRRETRARDQGDAQHSRESPTISKRQAPEPTSSDEEAPRRSYGRARERRQPRSVSSDSGGPGVRPQPPPPYHGKNLRELQDFVRTCEMIFQGARRRYGTDRQRIAMALPFVKGETGYAYDREKERRGINDAPTWEEFRWRPGRTNSVCKGFAS